MNNKVFGIIFGGIAILLAVFSVGTYLSYTNWAVDQEELIDAQVRQNQNAYSTFTQTAVDKMKVADAYKKGLQEIITAGIEGRYGGPGQKSIPMVVNEKYPGVFNETMFIDISRTIESGRRDFSQEQKLLISKVQGYRAELRKPWPKLWLASAGFPTIKLDEPKYNPVVTEATKETFQTGTDKGIQF